MSKSLGTKLQNIIEQRVPDPLTFALILTVVMAALALAFTDTKPDNLLLQWGDSLSALLSFTMQMTLIIITAYVLAHTQVVATLLDRLAGLAQSANQAYALVILTSATFSLLSWPLGPIAAGLVARKIAQQAPERGINVHFPLLAAGGFGGFVVWEMGYSSSIALAVATEGNPTYELMGRLIPIQETLLTTWNLLSIATTLATVIATTLWINRRLNLTATVVPDDMLQPLTTMNAKPVDGSVDHGGNYSGDQNANAVEGSRHLSLFAGGLVLAYVCFWFIENGISLQLNIVNWTFLGLGLLLVRSLPHYSDLFSKGAHVAAPTLLQYPLYAGIMGLAMQSGLAQQFSAYLVETTNQTLLPIVAFLSAGLVNIFIPSGGAQWALQGPSFVQAAQSLDVDMGVISMSIAYGDQWTNLIQPFTAVPILALTGLRLRHIYGFCLVLCATTSVPLLLGLAIANS